MRRNDTAVFLALAVLVAIAVQSAHALPLASVKREELVLSVGSSKQTNADKPNDVNADATSSSHSSSAEASAEPSSEHAAFATEGGLERIPHVGKLLMTPAAVASASDPMAAWSVPMINPGTFRPMPNVAKPPTAEAKPEHVPAVPAPTPTDAAAPTTNSTVPSPDADKLKEITDALAKAEANAAAGTADAHAADAPKDGKLVEKPAGPVSASAPPASAPGHRRRSMLRKRATQNDDAQASNRRLRRQLVRRNGPQRIVAREEEAQHEGGPSAEKGAPCEAGQEEQTFVPVTYSELGLIKQGQYKVQKANTEGVQEPNNACTATEDAEVVLVPVSDDAMKALQNGLLQLTGSGAKDTVILQTAQEAMSNELNNANGDEAAEDSSQGGAGPMFTVVPVDSASASDETATGSQLHIQLVPDSPQRRSQLSVAQVEHAGPSLLRRSLADQFGTLEKRVQPSSADNTSLFGNGAGKLKYGHKITYNAAPSSIGVPQSSSVWLFIAAIAAAVVHAQL